MAKGDIEWNSNAYYVLPIRRDGQDWKVFHSTKNQVVPILTSLGASPDARGGIFPIPMNIPFRGLGRKRMARNKDGRIDPKDFDRVWFTKFMNTIWSTQTTLQLGATAVTISVSNTARRLKASSPFKSNFYSLWEGETAGFAPTIHVSAFGASAPNWPTGSQVLTNSNESVALDLLAHKTHLLALFANDNDHLVYRSLDASSWGAATTQLTANRLSNAVTAQEAIDAGKLAEIAGEAIAIIWDEAGGTITFFSSTDAGDNWTDEAVDIATASGVKGAVAYQGIDGAIKLLVGTEEGLWEVDTSPATWTVELIHSMTPHADNCRGMTVHGDGSVWFGIGVDDNTPAGVVRYTAMNRQRVFEVNERFDADGNPLGIFLGPAAGDTCDSNLLGPIRWWKSSGGLLFAGVGGGTSSRTAWIMCHNGFGWHVFYYHDTANEVIDWIDVSSADDAVVRLHFAFNPTSTGHEASFLTRPLSNPIDGQTYTYYDGSTTPGEIHRPEYNLDIRGESKNWIDVRVEADDLGSTSAEYENIKFGADGAAADTTNLGDITSTVSKLKFGSDAGISAVSLAIAQRLFNKTGTTSSPFDKGLTVRVEPKFIVLNVYEFIIDVDETARRTGRSRKTIWAELDTIETSVPMLTFQFQGISQTRVTVPEGGIRRSLKWDVGTVTTDTTTVPRRGQVPVAVEER